eukprot:scaffold15981_cov69-Phaeocystis_antarctica.AAC.1
MQGAQMSARRSWVLEQQGEKHSAPGARWAGSGLPLPFGAETPLPLPLAQQPALGAGGWCGRGVPWVWLAG